nr:Chain A, drp4 [synthetic construct]
SCPPCHGRPTCTKPGDNATPEKLAKYQACWELLTCPPC